VDVAALEAVIEGGRRQGCRWWRRAGGRVRECVAALAASARDRQRVGARDATVLRSLRGRLAKARRHLAGTRRGGQPPSLDAWPAVQRARAEPYGGRFTARTVHRPSCACKHRARQGATSKRQKA
jgi:hypothetical protein